MGPLVVEENHLTEGSGAERATYGLMKPAAGINEGAATSILAQFSAFKDAVAVRSIRFPVTAPL